jgi:hypothetical protein
MSRPVEDLITIIRRHIDPGIDPTSLTDTNCWFWRGATDKDNYPRLKRGHPGRLLFLQHYTYEVPTGVRFRITPERCQNQLCINPRHYGIQPFKSWDMDINTTSWTATYNAKVFPPLILPDDPDQCPDEDDIEADLLFLLNLKDSQGWWKRPAQFWFDQFDPSDFTLELIQAAIDTAQAKSQNPRT